MESRKMVLMKLFVGQQWRHRHREQTMDMEEKVGCMERVTCKRTSPYVKQIANGNLLYDSGNSNWGSVTTKKGGMGRGGSKATYMTDSY